MKMNLRNVRCPRINVWHETIKKPMHDIFPYDVLVDEAIVIYVFVQKKKKDFQRNKQKKSHESTPFLPFLALWRPDRHGTFFHVIPIRTQRRAATLGVALQHGTLGVVVQVLEEL